MAARLHGRALRDRCVQCLLLLTWVPAGSQFTRSHCMRAHLHRGSCLSSGRTWKCPGCSRTAVLNDTVLPCTAMMGARLPEHLTIWNVALQEQQGIAYHLLQGNDGSQSARLSLQQRSSDDSQTARHSFLRRSRGSTGNDGSQTARASTSGGLGSTGRRSSGGGAPPALWTGSGTVRWAAC